MYQLAVQESTRSWQFLGQWTFSPVEPGMDSDHWGTSKEPAVLPVAGRQWQGAGSATI